MSTQLLTYNEHTEFVTVVADFLESHGLEMNDNTFSKIEEGVMEFTDNLSENLDSTTN